MQIPQAQLLLRVKSEKSFDRLKINFKCKLPHLWSESLPAKVMGLINLLTDDGKNKISDRNSTLR